MSPLSVCPVCLKVRQMTRHHIYPKRFFKKSPKFWLCRQCHNTLEKIMPRKKMSREWYDSLLKWFIRKESKW